MFRKYDALMQRIADLEFAIDTLALNPEWVDDADTGFNGQANRKAIFIDLLQTFRFSAIIETGTWIGNTTGFMKQQSGLPIHTCELNKRFHAIARMRLKKLEQIRFYISDSRKFLQALDLPASPEPLFIYLDAHWYDDLPLREEIEIIDQKFADFVIMVDDFKVEGDAAYGYDNYGRGKELSMAVFEKTFTAHGLTAFFPVLNGQQETGKKRGCVLLVKGERQLAKMNQIASLKPYGLLRSSISSS